MLRFMNFLDPPRTHHCKVALFEMLTAQKLKILAHNIVLGGFAKIVFMKRYDIKISFSGKCLNPFDRDCSSDETGK